jgi:FMN-dependent oxidoreductase (nitrilotriacetate monooxygenase family)
MRMMTMIGFLQAQNCTHLVASWRHPESRQDSTSPEFYQEIGRILEAGKFHMAFFDDRLAMPDRYGHDHAHAVENGIRCIKMDPVTVMMAMAMATTRLGLGATYSTTYYEPYHVARVFATADLMTKGRVAWNIVTSLNDGEAMNMGHAQILEHDLRYDRADEFLEVVLGHWDSWEEGAILADRATQRFADASRVHRLDHEGQFFRSRGPFTVPRSQQGQPVLLQAGQSGRGRRFAARWAEIVFMVNPNLEQARRTYSELRAEVAAFGREPDDVKVCALAYVACAATRAEAEDKMALIDRLPLEIDSLSLLSEAMNFDFAAKGMDEAFTTDELAGISGMQALRDRVVRSSGKANPTVRDFMHFSGRGRPHNAFVGSGKDVADGLEEWFTTGACDGFVLAATHVPGSYADFVQFVVPELQRRKLFHLDYAGETLRENLGLHRPVAGGWKANARVLA